MISDQLGNCSIIIWRLVWERLSAISAITRKMSSPVPRNHTSDTISLDQMSSCTLTGSVNIR